jgi:hypothetical protein
LKGVVVTERHRDAAHWARYVETLKAPDGIVHRNVEGRRPVSPLQGFGKMWQKTYRVRLEDASPSEVVATWRERFPEIPHPLHALRVLAACAPQASHERRRGGSLE